MGNNRNYMTNDWLTIDKTSGEGNAAITLTALPNEGINNRTKRFKIKGLTTSVFININQAHITPIVNIEKSNLSFDSFGGTQYVNINSNVLWDIKENEWVTTDFIEGEGNIGERSLEITVPSNSGGEREIIIPIYLRGDEEKILGKIIVTQLGFDSVVEIPTDVENCFYIEPDITDGKVVNISFAYSFESSNDGFNYLCDADIYYFRNGEWNRLLVNPNYNEYGSLKIQKRTYFKNFWRRSTYKFCFLTFDIKEKYNVGGDITTLLGPIEKPNGYNGTQNDNSRYASNLFSNTAIVDASKLILPYKTSYCAYLETFQGCSYLTYGPDLLAPILEMDCYMKMFEGCYNLKQIKMLATVVPEDDDNNMLTNGPLYWWVNGVGPNGVLIKCKDVDLPIGESGIPEGWEVYNTEPIEIPIAPETPDDENSEYFWVKLMKDGLIYGLYDNNGSMCYSYDKENWVNYNKDDQYIFAKAQQTVYFKNDNSSWVYTSHSSIYFTEEGKIGGDISSLGERVNFLYQEIFTNNDKLIDASKLVLPDTTLYESHYRNMFSGCTSLVSAPQLPATKLARECYAYMFSGCTSLVNAPELLASTLSRGCYMHMFRNCSNLQYIKMLATYIYNSEDFSTHNSLFGWLYGVGKEGMFIKHPDTNLERGTNGIPVGWTVENATI